MTRALLRHPTFLQHLSHLGRASDLVCLLSGGAGLVCQTIAYFLAPYEQVTSGKFWAYAALLFATGLFLWSREALRGHGGIVIWRLFCMGLVAGFLELLIDWALIHWIPNGRLTYLSGNDVVLLGSPIWMPLSWACVVTVVGYLGLRLFQMFRPRLGDRGALLVVSLITGLYASVAVGLNEGLAYRAGWWEYGPAHVMITPTLPLCIPLGEFFMFLALPTTTIVALTRDEHQPVEGAVLGGLLFGTAIGAGYGLAYLILEFGRSPTSG